MSEPGGQDKPIRRDRFTDRPQTKEEALLTQDTALSLLRDSYRGIPEVLGLLQWHGTTYELRPSFSGNPTYKSIYGSRVVTPDTIEISFGAVRGPSRTDQDPKEEGFRFQRPAPIYRGEKGVETEHYVLNSEGELVTTPSRNRVLRVPGSVKGSQAIIRFARSFDS